MCVWLEGLSEQAGTQVDLRVRRNKPDRSGEELRQLCVTRARTNPTRCLACEARSLLCVWPCALLPSSRRLSRAHAHRMLVPVPVPVVQRTQSGV